MKIFGYEFKAPRPQKPSEGESSGDSLRRMSQTIILPWESGREITPIDRYRELIAAYTSWVYVCSSKNSNAVAAAPLRLYVGKKTKNTKVIVKTIKLDRQREDRIRKQGNLIPYHRKAEEIEEVVEHPFLDTIKKVNPIINRFDLWDGTQLWLELTGNAFWYIYKDNLGVPQELWPLPPQYMKIIGSRDKIVAGYVYQRAVAKIPFENEEIIHFKFFSPSGSLYGTGPLSAVMESVIDDKNIRAFESTLMKNMGRPEGILQSKDGISETDFNRMKSRWNQQYGGVNKAGKTIILENGLEYKPLTFTPREMNYVVGRKMNREEIAAAFGVPMSKLTTEAVNLANAYVGEHQYMQDTIEPRLRRIEETINEKLMPMYDENLFVAYDSVVPSDKNFELSERTANLGSYITTINEEREKMGLDKVEWGDVPLAPVGIAPLGSQQPAPGEEGLPEEETSDGEGDELGVEAIDAASSGEVPEDLSDEEIAAGIAALGGKMITKGGEGSGITGHRTIRDSVSKLSPKAKKEALEKLRAEQGGRAGRNSTSTSEVPPKIVELKMDYVKGVDQEQAEQLRSEISKWNGQRNEVANRAIGDMRDGCEGIIVRSGSKLAGVATYDRRGGVLTLNHIATGRKGAGRQTIQEIATIATKTFNTSTGQKGVGLQFVSALGADGFYKKLGITVGPNSVCKVSREEVIQLAIEGRIAKSSKKEVDSVSVAEPENGVFVDSKRVVKKKGDSEELPPEKQLDAMVAKILVRVREKLNENRASV